MTICRRTDCCAASRGDRGFLLASVMVEDRRAVLAAEIKALAVAGGRIWDPPERLQQLRVTDLVRVEPHLDRLGVAGAVPGKPAHRSGPGHARRYSRRQSAALRESGGRLPRHPRSTLPRRSRARLRSGRGPRTAVPAPGCAGLRFLSLNMVIPLPRLTRPAQGFRHGSAGAGLFVTSDLVMVHGQITLDEELLVIWIEGLPSRCLRRQSFQSRPVTPRSSP